jgi:hypothetical protein
MHRRLVILNKATTLHQAKPNTTRHPNSNSNNNNNNHNTNMRHHHNNSPLHPPSHHPSPTAT